MLVIGCLRKTGSGLMRVLKNCWLSGEKKASVGSNSLDVLDTKDGVN